MKWYKATVQVHARSAGASRPRRPRHEPRQRRPCLRYAERERESWLWPIAVLLGVLRSPLTEDTRAAIVTLLVPSRTGSGDQLVDGLVFPTRVPSLGSVAAGPVPRAGRRARRLRLLLPGRLPEEEVPDHAHGAPMSHRLPRSQRITIGSHVCAECVRGGIGSHVCVECVRGGISPFAPRGDVGQSDRIGRRDWDERPEP